jgi:phospholipase/lecithinase/hemolysin
VVHRKTNGRSFFENNEETDVQIKPWAALTAMALALSLAACGGSEDGDQTPRASYGKLVSFGDSLSDVGSYRVGVVAAMGGGRYTVNGSGGENWTELLAAQLGVDAPCAAQTGLNSAAALGGPVAVENHAGCYGYAQGGARVTELVGPGNAALLALGDSSGALGQLTDPVVNQITRHLSAVGGRFAADDLVTVMAGGNDLFMNLATLQAQVEAGADATTAATAAVTAMGVAGAELAGYVKAMILAKGAERVVVVNLPDVSLTPMAASLDAGTRGLIQTMASTFNAQLAAGLGTTAGVLAVDAFTASQSQHADPAQYGVSNATTPACDLSGALASLPTSLVCTSATTVAADTSRYYFADTVHPTPYGYKLLTQLVTDALLKAGWL